ncbi:MAG TPA: hypothetical protein VIU63_01275 [Nitrospira sp.]
MKQLSFAIWTVMMSIFIQPLSFAQDAILPQGDPRLQNSEENQAQRNAIRDSRVGQQGQGEHYRIEGEPHPSSAKGEQEESNGLTRQNTGIADPSVNPGQAEGMKTIHGRIIQSTDKRHVVRQPGGKETTLIVDARTTGETDLHPGDVITGTMTPQGRAVAIHKEAAPR